LILTFVAKYDVLRKEFTSSSRKEREVRRENGRIQDPNLENQGISACGGP